MRAGMCISHSVRKLEFVVQVLCLHMAFEATFADRACAAFETSIGTGFNHYFRISRAFTFVWMTHEAILFKRGHFKGCS